MAFGIDPMPTWIVAPFGIRSATRPAMRWSSSSLGAGGTSTGTASDSVQPTTWLMCTWLRPKVRGSEGLASRNMRARPMNDEV